MNRGYYSCSKCGKLFCYPDEINSIWITNETCVYWCEGCKQKAKDLNTTKVKK